MAYDAGGGTTDDSNASFGHWDALCGYSCNLSMLPILFFFLVWNSALGAPISASIIVPSLRCTLNWRHLMICICPHWLVGFIIPVWYGGFVGSLSFLIPYSVFIWRSFHMENADPNGDCFGWNPQNADDEVVVIEAPAENIEDPPEDPPDMLKQEPEGNSDDIELVQAQRIRMLEAQVLELQQQQGQGLPSVVVATATYSDTESNLPLAESTFCE